MHFQDLLAINYIFAVKGGFIMFRNKENTVIKAAFLLPIFYTLFIYSAIFGAPRIHF